MVFFSFKEKKKNKKRRKKRKKGKKEEVGVKKATQVILLYKQWFGRLSPTNNQMGSFWPIRGLVNKLIMLDLGRSKQIVGIGHDCVLAQLQPSPCPSAAALPARSCSVVPLGEAAGPRGPQSVGAAARGCWMPVPRALQPLVCLLGAASTRQKEEEGEEGEERRLPLRGWQVGHRRAGQEEQMPALLLTDAATRSSGHGSGCCWEQGDEKYHIW